jgi:hypothetical protein
MDQRQRIGLPESSSVDARGAPPARLTPQILRALLPNLTVLIALTRPRFVRSLGPTGGLRRRPLPPPSELLPRA